MSETSNLIQVTKCPHCRKAYKIRAESVGRKTQCRQCGQTFVVTLEESAAPATPREETVTSLGAGGILCPVCQVALGGPEEVTSCPICVTKHHKDCWEYNRGCGLYGCAQAPATEKLQDIEIPASYWGQTEKVCPKCNNRIQAAALRCRFCGEVYQSARPQAMSEFYATQQLKDSLSVHRKIGAGVLVCAVIPCTAPLAAIFGVIWYLVARKNIAALPPLQATVCRLGVAVALVVSILEALFAVIYSLAQ